MSEEGFKCIRYPVCVLHEVAHGTVKTVNQLWLLYDWIHVLTGVSLSVGKHICITTK